MEQSCDYILKGRVIRVNDRKLVQILLGKNEQPVGHRPFYLGIDFAIADWIHSGQFEYADIEDNLVMILQRMQQDHMDGVDEYLRPFNMVLDEGSSRDNPIFRITQSKGHLAPHQIITSRMQPRAIPVR